MPAATLLSGDLFGGVNQFILVGLGLKQTSQSRSVVWDPILNTNY